MNDREAKRTAGSLSARLALRSALGVAVALSISGTALSWAFRNAATEAFRTRLDTNLDALVAETDAVLAVRATQPRNGPENPAETSVEGEDAGGTPPMLGEPRFDRPRSGWYWQITEADGDGNPIARSRSLWDSVLPGIEAEGDRAKRASGFVIGPGRVKLLAVEQRIVSASSETPLDMIVAAELSEVDRAAADFDATLFISLGILAVALLAGAAAQIRGGLSPLRLIEIELSELRDGRIRRLGEKHPTEIAPLVRAMNAVLDADADLIRRSRTHLGNLAHAMKTPVAVLSGEIARGNEAEPAVMSAALDDVRRIMDRQLARAEADAIADRPIRSSIDAVAAAESVLRAVRKAHSTKGLHISLDADGTPSFLGEEEDLQEIVGNLLDNACKWAKRVVALRLVAKPGKLVVIVDDDGPGLPLELMDAVTKRGARLDESIPGSGLGLSIADELAKAHGGELLLGASALGGLRVSVVLPAAADPKTKKDEETA